MERRPKSSTGSSWVMTRNAKHPFTTLPTIASALTAMLIAAGCGGSSAPSGSPAETGSSQPSSGSASSTQATTANPQASSTDRSSEPLPSVTLDVSVPVLLPGNYIPKLYTCDGANRSLPVQWSGIPPGTAELVLFIINFQPVHGSIFFDWAVAGLKPTSRQITAGKLPAGAVVGRNSFGNAGYTICPPTGTRASYAVKLLALPHPLAAQPGFAAAALYEEASREAKVVGFAGTEYKRS